MFRNILRLTVLILVTAAMVFAAVKYLPGQWLMSQKYAQCRAATTADCLAELGFAEADRVRSLPSSLGDFSKLAQIGYLEHVYALELRIQQSKYRFPEDAKTEADSILASERITAAIRAGATAKQALDQTPQADGGDLWISARDLLRQRQHGPSPGPDAPPDATTRLRVAEMADLIASLAEVGNPPHDIYMLKYAAELQAILQNREAAIGLLSRMPTEKRKWDWWDDILLQAIGADVAVSLCETMVDCQITARIKLALAAGDAVSARADLEQRFNTFAEKTPLAFTHKMAWLVELVAKGGDRDNALVLARRLFETVKTKPHLMPGFALIDAARALQIAGAGADEVRQVLDLAEAAIPKSDRTIFWFENHLGWFNGMAALNQEARSEIAGLRAILGELDAAKTLMAGIYQPAVAWRDMLSPDILVAFLDPLLQTARAAMSAEDFAFVRAHLAQDIADSSPSDAHRMWAKATAIDILDAKLLSRVTYSHLLMFGEKTKDDAIYHKAVERIAQSALASGDIRDLFQAAIAWHNREATTNK